jgi:hypothetical protein
MKWVCFAAALLIVVTSLEASPSRAGDAGKKRYSCPRTLLSARPDGKPRHLVDVDVFDGGLKDEVLEPDDTDNVKRRVVWKLLPDYAPFGLRCYYDDRSEVIVNIPMAKFCEGDWRPGHPSAWYLFCEDAAASPSRANGAEKTRYSCPRTLPPAHPGGKPRHLKDYNPYSDFPEAILVPDSGGQYAAAWHLLAGLGPYGLSCTYDDKSELDIPLPPTVRRCFVSRAVDLFCD